MFFLQIRWHTSLKTAVNTADVVWSIEYLHRLLYLLRYGHHTSRLHFLLGASLLCPHCCINSSFSCHDGNLSFPSSKLWMFFFTSHRSLICLFLKHALVFTSFLFLVSFFVWPVLGHEVEKKLQLIPWCGGNSLGCVVRNLDSNPDFLFSWLWAVGQIS